MTEHVVELQAEAEGQVEQPPEDKLHELIHNLEHELQHTQQQLADLQKELDATRVNELAVSRALLEYLFMERDTARKIMSQQE